MPVGDINSVERGSGARYNDGKPDLSLIPPVMLPCHDEGSDHYSLLQAIQFYMFLEHGDRLWAWMDAAMATSTPECARVFEYGREKYSAWNWAKGMNWSIPIACTLRHAHALYYEGEVCDRESGLPHIGHILCNLVMLRHFAHTFPEGNDLPYKVLSHA